MSSLRRLPVDPALPQMHTALDAPAMGEVFGALLAEHGAHFTVVGCDVDRIKYHPRRNVAVSYRLKLRDVEGRDVEQRIAARFCSAGESARRHARSVASATWPSAAGPRSTWSEMLDMCAMWWPNDAKLGRAAQWFGAGNAGREDALRDVVAALTQGQGELVGHAFTLAQVVAEHRACARVALTYRPEPGAAAQQRTVYVKADVAHPGDATFDLLHALSHSDAQARGVLRTPAPILWQPDPGLLWSAEVPGHELLDETIGTHRAAQVGTLVAALHATPAPAPRRVDEAELRERLRHVVDTLARVEPRWDRPARRLAARLDASLALLTAAPEVTLHGDLHPRNILVDGERVGLIDLDGARRGPAVRDLGDWIADQLYRALLEGRDPADALPSSRAFLAAYGEAAHIKIEAAEVATSTAYSLLCQRAWRAVVNLKPGRYELVEPLLALAWRIADAGSIDAASSLRLAA